MVVGDVSVAELGPVSLIHVRHDGAELRVRFTEMVSYYDVHLPVVGGTLVECGGEEVVLGGWRTGGVISPEMRARMPTNALIWCGRSSRWSRSAPAAPSHSPGV